MALSIVTRGYLVGSGALVVTRGYSTSGAAATGVAIRRRKTKIWGPVPDLPEVEIYETRAAELEGLLDQRAYVLGETQTARRAQLASLRADLRQIDGRIKQIRVRLAKEQQDAALAIKWYRDEEEDISQIMQFIVQLDD